MAAVRFPSGCTGSTCSLLLTPFVRVASRGGGEEDVEGIWKVGLGSRNGGAGNGEISGI